MLVRAFGEFWNPETVNWPAEELPGRATVQRNRVSTDVWGQVGIYVLSMDFRAVYVGRGDIGARLKKHRADRHAGRWDSFSWYGMKIIKKDGTLRAAPAKRIIKLDEIVKSLEALTIAVMDPPLNRRREALRNAVEVEQAVGGTPRSVRGYLEEIVNKLNA